MFLVVILLCLSFGNCAEANQFDDKLTLTQIVGIIHPSDFQSYNINTIIRNQLFRHGARTIRKPYENDPYKDKSHWPEGFGQLTNVG